MTEHAASDDSIIRIDQPDDPIHRIFPLWFLEDTLRRRKLALASPRRWEDPFEIIGDAIAVNWREDDSWKQRDH